MNEYCITIWKDEENIADNFLSKFKYLIFGCDEWTEDKIYHYHVYCKFKKPHTLQSIKSYFGDTSHVEPRSPKSSPEQARQYCIKAGTPDFVEWGSLPKRQGSRTDLSAIRDQILKENKQVSDIIGDISNYQQLKFAEGLMKYQKVKLRQPPNVIWIWGASGTGKTRKAIELAGDDFWISSQDLKWWQGYHGQKVVILDEFRSDFCPYHELLRILDRYPYTVQFKGGSCPLLAETIIITSCYKPKDCYQTIEDKQQLIRRISEVIHL